MIIFKKLINNELKDTGLIALKFNITTLPNDISIGYEKVSVKKFIPNPLKCKNSHRIGHHTTKCRSEKLCYKYDEKNAQRLITAKTNVLIVEVQNIIITMYPIIKFILRSIKKQQILSIIKQ